jgi:hypothetical protein
VKFAQQLPEPGALGDGVCDSAVLGLRARP